MKSHGYIATILFLVVAAGCTQDQPVGPALTSEGEPLFSRGHTSAAVNRQLAAVRQATVQFRHMTEAELLARGYVNTQICVPGMGIHFVDFDAIDETVDPLRPEALVYEPKPHGRLQLVAVEYLARGSDSPVLFGRTMHEFELPFADWELHAWVWKGNPAGVFESMNPNVSCPTP
jgi:hypothetical protein